MRRREVLAATGGIPLENLRPDREHVGTAQRQHLCDRVCVDDYVVVHQESAVVADAFEAAFDCASKAERTLVVYPFHMRKPRLHVAIDRTRRAIGGDDHLPRLGDGSQCIVERGKRFPEHDWRIAIGDDHRDAWGPRSTGSHAPRRNQRRQTIGNRHGRKERQEAQPLPPACPPPDCLS